VPNSVKIIENIYLVGDSDVLVELLKTIPNPKLKVRFFLGYSIWAKDQLDDEIRGKSWIIVKSNADKLIMDTSSNRLWQECL
jgi:putative transcriptional regulator